jgi:hypothetical protein
MFSIVSTDVSVHRRKRKCDLLRSITPRRLRFNFVIAYSRACGVAYLEIYFGTFQIFENVG